MKNFGIFAILLLSSALSAQCWLPTGLDPFNSQWNTCHHQAGAGVYSHRFQWDQMDDRQRALVQAIAMVEQGLSEPSEINPEKANKRGDNGNAVGPLQIWSTYFLDAINSPGNFVAPSPACYPDHCERHCMNGGNDLEEYMYWYFWWSNNCGVWYAYMQRYAPQDMINMDAAAAERIARKHNGGPNGHNNPNTQSYWNKVKLKLQQEFPGVIPGI